MHEINITFERMSECPIADLLGTVGVYVLWDSQAKTCPTYIGEGDILTRLNAHAAAYAMPIDGYVAITGDGSRKYHKGNAQIVEFLLLKISKRIGQKTPYNKKAGSFQKLIDVLKAPKGKPSDEGLLDFFFGGSESSKSDRKIKVHLKSGFDPFNHPADSNRMKKTWSIEVARRNGRLFLDHHPWINQETDECRGSASEL